jgi:DNA-binding beta-propeller fold protein YncE
MGFDFAALDSGVSSSALLGHVSKTQQGDFAPVYSSACPNGPNNVGVADPAGVAVDMVGSRLFVADRSNHRVLVFRLGSDNKFSSREAAFVIGQQDFASCTSGTSERALANPSDIVFDGIRNRLYVADTGNQRVLVFPETSFLGNNGPATSVLGQVNFGSVDRDGGSRARFGSTIHLAVDSDGDRLFVSDGEANRVLVFYAEPPNITPPFPNGADAGFVIGQPSFTSYAADAGQASFYGPRGMAFDSVANRLFVADFSNRRVMVFDTSAIQNGMAASYVLGQPDFFSTNTVPAAAGGVFWPRGVALDRSRTSLLVSDTGYHRVAIFDLTRLATGLMATTALGQPDFTTFAPGLSSLSMKSPVALVASPTQLFAVDSLNDRVLVFGVGP